MQQSKEEIIAKIKTMQPTIVLEGDIAEKTTAPVLMEAINANNAATAISIKNISLKTMQAILFAAYKKSKITTFIIDEMKEAFQFASFKKLQYITHVVIEKNNENIVKEILQGFESSTSDKSKAAFPTIDTITCHADNLKQIITSALFGKAKKLVINELNEKVLNDLLTGPTPFTVKTIEVVSADKTSIERFNKSRLAVNDRVSLSAPNLQQAVDPIPTSTNNAVVAEPVKENTLATDSTEKLKSVEKTSNPKHKRLRKLSDKNSDDEERTTKKVAAEKYELDLDDIFPTTPQPEEDVRELSPDTVNHIREKDNLKKSFLSGTNDYFKNNRNYELIKEYVAWHTRIQNVIKTNKYLETQVKQYQLLVKGYSQFSSPLANKNFNSISNQNTNTSKSAVTVNKFDGLDNLSNEELNKQISLLKDEYQKLKTETERNQMSLNNLNEELGHNIKCIPTRNLTHNFLQNSPPRPKDNVNNVKLDLALCDSGESEEDDSPKNSY